MMRLLLDSYSRKMPVLSSASLSVLAHAAIISAWVLGTLPRADMPFDSVRRQPIYLPPPDRAPSQGGSREAVHYIKLAPEGPGAGEGPRMMGDARPPATPEQIVGDRAKDTVTSPPVPQSTGQDSVYSVLEVDVAVVRAANSAAPAYPLKMLQAHISGSVAAQYIVDTTGFADTSSFQVLNSPRPEFIQAVKEVLPYMRFEPAKIGRTKVRQLVEQQFSFKIADTDTAAAKARKP
jgi:outer membrane biosynthesis protein TonB